MKSYIRGDDNALMVLIEPHRFISAYCAEKLMPSLLKGANLQRAKKRS
jgi:hypothetical protein